MICGGCGVRAAASTALPFVITGSVDLRDTRPRVDLRAVPSGWPAAAQVLQWQPEGWSVVGRRGAVVGVASGVTVILEFGALGGISTEEGG